jgi:hypothetical protein
MKVIDGSPPAALLETIGILPAVGTVIFVEDEAARAFCHELLELFKPALSRRTEIVVRGGEGNITTALRSVGGAVSAIGFVGVYDGDQRGRVSDDVSGFATFLPLTQPVEIIFRNLIEADPVLFRDATGRTDIEVVLSSLEGQEHHEWYDNLCRLTGIEKPQLFPQLFRLWLRDDANRARAAETVDEIVRLSKFDLGG